METAQTLIRSSAIAFFAADAGRSQPLDEPGPPVLRKQNGHPHHRARLAVRRERGGGAMKNTRFLSVAFLVAGLMLAQRMANAQVVTTLAGSGGSGSGDGKGAEAAFWDPQGLAVDTSGNVYAADTTSLKIRKVTPDGLVTTVAGNGHPGYEDGVGTKARFFGPLGVAVDASGNVWVADQDDGIDGQYIKK